MSMVSGKSMACRPGRMRATVKLTPASVFARGKNMIGIFLSLKIL
jgi:hypothetical protein